MSFPAHMTQDERDRPNHPRLTSSAYLLGGPLGGRDKTGFGTASGSGSRNTTKTTPTTSGARRRSSDVSDDNSSTFREEDEERTRFLNDKSYTDGPVDAAMTGSDRRDKQRGRAGGDVEEGQPMVGNEAMRLGTSFFCFGMLIAMQFSVVTAAAGDLVGDKAPKSAVLTAYTLPSVMVRLLVPFASMPPIKPTLRKIPFVRKFIPKRRGGGGPRPPPSSVEEEEVNYPWRIGVCSVCSFVGLNLLAWSGNLLVRLVGIALASCSSNLGDLTFYQMSTRYPSNITQSVGLYTSGGGAAGLAGALTYTVLTQLGASPSAVISGTGLVPLVILTVYNFWLPGFPKQAQREEKKPGARKEGMIKDLGTRAKLSIAKPIVRNYMLPLCTIFLVELIDVQGVLATVIFYLPFAENQYAKPSILNDLFPARRSFYPVYQTLYQFAAFVGRSTITIVRLPGGKRGDPTALWALVGIEVVILLCQLRESLSMSGTDDSATLYGPWMVMFLVVCMGMCGGAELGNTYYRMGRHPLPETVFTALAKARKRKRIEDSARDALLDFSDDEDEIAADEREGEEEQEILDEVERGRGLARPTRLTRNPSMMSLQIREERRAEDAAALKEFLVSTIGSADTLAILISSCIAMIVEPRLCDRQKLTGRHQCGAV